MAERPKNAAGYELDPCDWSKAERGVAVKPGSVFCGWAVWSVGTGKRNLHLCESCAANAREVLGLRKRVWIGPKREVERGTETGADVGAGSR